MALACFFAHELYAEPLSYQLNFEVYRNGKLSGQAEVTMRKQEERWIIRSEGSGTRGLGRLLGVTDAEQVEGYFLDDKFRPDRFSHHSRLAGISDDWSAEFNWQANTVTTTKGKQVLSLDMGPGALDTLSLKVELQRRLRLQEPDLQFFEVTDDKIKPRTYRTLPLEQLETPLGCLAAIPVELVPGANTRYYKSWHAPALDFLTVRLERGKKDGAHMEMRITSMVLAGKEVVALAPCAATQSGKEDRFKLNLKVADAQDLSKRVRVEVVTARMAQQSDCCRYDESWLPVGSVFLRYFHSRGLCDKPGLCGFDPAQPIQPAPGWRKRVSR